MRSTEAGISRLGSGTRVAVTTTVSCSCARRQAGRSASTAPTRIFCIFARLPGMLARVSFAAFLAAFVSLSSAQPDAALLRQLREGGYVLYLRHTSTDFSQNDANMKDYEDCANQRNLTDKGRAEARAIGEHIKRLGIPVGRVLASPFCRTVETAKLAFGKAQPMNEVRGGPSRPEDPKRHKGLRTLLATPPSPGRNTLTSRPATPFPPLPRP